MTSCSFNLDCVRLVTMAIRNSKSNLYSVIELHVSMLIRTSDAGSVS